MESEQADLKAPKRKQKTPPKVWEAVQHRLWLAAAREVLSPVTMGIAHDLNNQLTWVLSISDLCLRDINPDNPLREQLQLIRRSSQRAAELVRSLFMEHQANVGRTELHDLNGLAQAYATLARQAIPKSIAITVDVSSEPLPVTIDAVAFRTVMLHLALNAAEAIRGRGKVELRTFSESKLRAAPPAKKGKGTLSPLTPALSPLRGEGEERVGSRKRGGSPEVTFACLEVSDDGVGFDPALVGALNDPLFTTKAGNLGAGWGLYLAGQFAKAAQGSIAIERGSKAGTTVTVRIPQAAV